MRIVAAALVLLFAAPAGAGVLDDDNYSIMKPEPNFPGVVNRYRSPRVLKQHVKTPKPQPEATRRIPQMPPPVINPKTGVALPNLPPPVPGSGVGGRETGWIQIDGSHAFSTVEQINDPAVYAVLVEKVARSAGSADLPFGKGTQVNGDLWPIGNLGDGGLGDNQ